MWRPQALPSSQEQRETRSSAVFSNLVVTPRGLQSIFWAVTGCLVCVVALVIQFLPCPFGE